MLNWRWRRFRTAEVEEEMDLAEELASMDNESVTTEGAKVTMEPFPPMMLYFCSLPKAAELELWLFVPPTKLFFEDRD